MKVSISELPEGLTELGRGAFWQTGPNVTISKLPSSLSVLDNFTFFNCENVAITSFGENGGAGLTTLGSAVLNGCGKHLPPNTIIYINESVTTLKLASRGIGGDDAFIPNPVFTGYGTNRIVSVSAPMPETGYTTIFNN